LNHYYNRFLKAITTSLNTSKECAKNQTNESKLLWDTYCGHALPNGTEYGVFYTIGFKGTVGTVQRLSLEGYGKHHIIERRVSLRDPSLCGYPKGLLDSRATTAQLFDTFAVELKGLMTKEGDMYLNDLTPIGVVWPFKLQKTAIYNGTCTTSPPGYDTGKSVGDPIRGKDIEDMLNSSFERHRVPARVAAVTSLPTAVFMACCYETGSTASPACQAGVIIGEEFSACYLEPLATKCNYVGHILEIDMDAILTEEPACEVIERLVGKRATYNDAVAGRIGELCYQILRRIFGERRSESFRPFPATVAALILRDSSSTSASSTAKMSLKSLWHCVPDDTELKIIRHVCGMVLNRSAALAAVAIASMATKTQTACVCRKRVTVSVDGWLYAQSTWYEKKVKEHIKSILGAQADSVRIKLCLESSPKGGGILVCNVTGTG